MIPDPLKICLFRYSAIGAGFLKRLCHLLDAHLFRIVGYRVDLLGSPESLGNVCYTVKPFQG